MAWTAAAILAGWLVSHLGTALGLFDRVSTLHGRTPVWPILLELGAEQKWLGYGLNSFWNQSSETYGEVMKTLGWFPGHSHNGLIDIYLELGLIGIAIFLACLCRVSIQAFRDAISSARTLDCWHIVFLVFMTTYNLAESQLFNPGALNWFLFVTATCNLFGRLERRPRRSGRPLKVSA